MMTIRVHQSKSKLDSIINISLGMENDEIKSHLAKYICVLISGHIEKSVKLIINEYVYHKANKAISDYVNVSLSKSTNYNFEKICQLLFKFNNDWGKALKDQTTEKEIHSINSIIANRHLIAHGENSGISFVLLNEWFKDTNHVLNRIDQIINAP